MKHARRFAALIAALLLRDYPKNCVNLQAGVE